MNEKSTIDAVLKDLYAIDPSLRDQEERLIKTVRALLAAKPEAALDERFVSELRDELLDRFAAGRAGTAAVRKSFIDSLMKKDALKYLVPSGIAAALVLALVISTKTPTQPPAAPIASGTPETPRAEGVRISRVAGNFGKLSTTGGGDAAMEAGRGQGGGGGGVPSATPQTASPSPDKMAIMPYEPTYYKYVYDGDIALTDEKLDVYKRRKGGVTPISPSLLDTALLGLMDPARLGSLGVQSLSLVQDKDFGYSVYVDMHEGMVSLGQNYAKWPHPEQDCRDEACYARYRLQESDMLTDEQAFAISDAFLKELGVNTGSYGAPTIQNSWRMQLAATSLEDRANFYFPDIMSVVYPLSINGQKVHDEGGGAMGLVVNVNVRQKRADGLWNLTTLDFDSAQYDAVTDKTALLEVVSRGGVYEGTPPADAKTVEVKLGTPERVLMRAWSGGQEVVVPALRFPVLDKPEGQMWFRDAVMIPLVKDLLAVPTPNPILMVK